MQKEQKETKLQIPVSTKFKSALSKRADELGLSSANELARFVLHQFVKGAYHVAFIESHKAAIEVLDPDTDKRIAESLDEIKQGKYDIIDLSNDRTSLRKYIDEL